MKCFDVVQTVLDATYEEVPGTGKERDASVKKAIETTRARYTGGQLMTKGGPDFSDPATRFGYVFVYTPAHAYWLFEAIGKAKGIRSLFEKGKARVICLGGGPGSDVVGLLKFLDDEEIECKLFVDIVDGCLEWQATWRDLAYELDTNSLHTTYVTHDVGEKATWNAPSNIAKADIITISFFISEVFHLKSTKKYLATMLGAAKPGAFLFVNDNRTQEVYDLIDEVAKDCGFKTLLADAGDRRIRDWTEKADALAKYQKKFGANTRLTANMFRRIYRKT